MRRLLGERKNSEWKELVGTGRFELPTPRTPSECSTRLSHVPTEEVRVNMVRMGLTSEFYTTSQAYAAFGVGRRRKSNYSVRPCVLCGYGFFRLGFRGLAFNGGKDGLSSNTAN
jgi:hypothetical protein